MPTRPPKRPAKKGPPAKIEQVLARIRAFRAAAGLSKRGLADRAGLSNAGLVGMDRPDWSPQADTLRAIEGILPEGWRPGDRVPPKFQAQGQAAAQGATP